MTIESRHLDELAGMTLPQSTLKVLVARLAQADRPLLLQALATKLGRLVLASLLEQHPEQQVDWAKFCCELVLDRVDLLRVFVARGACLDLIQGQLVALY
jgi:hypothetical protein